MKQKSFIIIALAFFTLSINAKTTTVSKNSYFIPIEFIEQGIQFTIFQNGTFDFRFDSRTNANRSYSLRCNREVVRDRYGKIRRVGNVFVDYDRYGRLTNIGNINIRFRDRCITAIGGLQIHYNNFGFINYSGSVNRNIRPQIQYRNSSPKHRIHKNKKTKLKSYKKYKKSRRA